MAISGALVKASRWVDSCIASITEAVQGMVSSFTLESLYPETEDEVDGELIVRHEILPHQLLVHNPPVHNGKTPTFVLHNGGYGSGKSVNMTVQMVYLARKYPGIKITVIAPYDYNFEEFIWPTWEKILDFNDPLVKDMNRKNREIWLVNGSYIRFKAYEDPQRIKGWESHIIWIEEGSELGGGDPHKAIAIFYALLGRLRAKPAKYPRMMYISQNPAGHNWLWKLFIKNSPYRDNPSVTWVKEPGTDKDHPQGICYKEYWYESDIGEVYYTVSSGTRSNTKNPPGYEERMLSQFDDEMKRRFIEGDFNPINTLVYCWPVYDVGLQVIEYSRFLEYWELDDSECPEIPAFWRVVVGIDVGGPLSPWSAQFYVVTPPDEYGDEHFVCFDEIYMKGVTSWKEPAEAILAKVEKFEHVDYYIDPKSGPKREGPNQESIIDNFRQYGIDCKIPRYYTKQAGSLAVKSLMVRDKEKPHPYKDDYIEENSNTYYWGGCRMYYLRDSSWAVSEQEADDAMRSGDKAAFPNPKGYANPANIKEKEVWRFNKKKLREPKESEEGLSPPVQEKFVDSDDHAQTAEIFAVIGYSPLLKWRDRKKSHREPRQPYDGRMRHH